MKVFSLFLFCCFCPYMFAICDLTLIGSINEADGIGGLPIGVIKALKDDLKINVIPINRGEPVILKDEDVRKILDRRFRRPGRVSLLLDNMLWTSGGENYTKVPQSDIKIAYSMFETSRIPRQWVKILNEHFDLVAVPDPYWIESYRKSGVKIPIFMVPLGINTIDELMEKEDTPHPQQPFVFGSTVANNIRKNLPLLMEAFNEEFDLSENVILRINSRLSTGGTIRPTDPWFTSIAKNRIFFTDQMLSRSEYIDLLRSFDCYINIAKGEGFSITPREALALRIPCIVTNNTAQITICNSGLVRAVPSEIKEPAPSDYLATFKNTPLGNCFNCTKEDVRKALRDVYQNYSQYREKANKGPEWVAQYSWKNLKLKYLNLIKPKRIRFGDKNEVTNNYFMTDSRELYEKYLKVFSNEGKSLTPASKSKGKSG